MKDPQLFEEWLSKLTHHRLYRQHEITYGTKDQPRLTELASPTEEITSLPTSKGIFLKFVFLYFDNDCLLVLIL